MYYYSSKFAWPTQMIRKMKAPGVGNSSRQGAKAQSDGHGPSSRANARNLRKISPVGRNDNPFSFAAFAALREILRDLVAASPRWALCGEFFVHRLRC